MRRSMMRMIQQGALQVSLLSVSIILMNWFPVIESERLPKTIVPVHYDLVILPILINNPRLCGHLLLDFEVSSSILSPTNTITLHGVELDLIEVKLVKDNPVENRFEKLEDICFSGLSQSPREGNNPVDEIGGLSQDEENQKWNVTFSQALIPDRRYRLAVYYIGKINDDIQGFFRGSYVNEETCCQRWFGGTQMEPVHARRVLPCFDEPNFKATFDVTIGHHRSMSALSNMPQASTFLMENTEDWKWTTFMRTPPMSTYVLAFFLTEDKYVEREYIRTFNNKKSTIKLRFWARPEYLPYLNASISLVPKVLDYLETHLKQAFPLPKIDFVAPPMQFRFNAMENWGLILLSEALLLHDEEFDSTEQLFVDVQVIVHELVHQYFGNLVTHDWWDEVSLKEGLSVLYEHLIIEKVMPELKMNVELSWAKSFHNLMEKEEREQTLSVFHPVESETEIEQLFSPITYAKGSIIFKMLENLMGKETFRDGLVSYIQRYQFKSVSSPQLWEVFNEEMIRYHGLGVPSKEFNLTSIMESWMTQNSYPLIRCFRSTSNRIQLSQSPFPTDSVIAKLEIGSASSSLWWIPITMIDSSASSSLPGMPRLWLTPQRPALNVAVRGSNSEWIVVNAEMTAYFRVQYDEHNYRLLSEQLIRNHSVFSDVTRLQLLTDAFTLAERQLINYETPLDLVRYLRVIDDRFVLPSAIEHLKRIKDILPQHREVFQEYVNQLSLPKGNTGRIGSDPHLLEKNNCEKGEPFCVDQALLIYRALMTNKITDKYKRTMSENFDLIWCTSIRYGGETEWKFAWDKSLDNRWYLQRDKILSALACSPNEKKLKKLLARAFHPSPYSRSAHLEIITVLESMLAVKQDPTTRSLAHQFIKSNWKILDEITDQYSSARHFSSKMDSLTFLNRHHQSGSIRGFSFV